MNRSNTIPSNRTKSKSPVVLLMGDPGTLRLAYSAKARSKASNIGSLQTEELTDENWVNFSETTREVEIILSTWGMPQMNENFLAAFPKLRAVFYAAGSVKGFVTDASYDRHIVVSSSASANAIPVAEYTLSAVLMSLKRFWSFTREIHRARIWNRCSDSAPGNYHSTVGLVSLGAVGRSVARMLSRFDLDLIAYDPFIPKSRIEELGIEMVSIEELFSRSDVVSLHAPSIPETEGFINEPLLRMMKRGATFINTSRGAIVNEADLCRVLKERKDLTAILDVTCPEPPSSKSPLYELDNVVLTPHIAGSMGTEIARMGDWMIEELERFIEGAPLHHQVVRNMLSRLA